jgi:heat-inducible transcriptional repressor
MELLIMRILKPEIAQERKDKILNWVMYNYISTGRPVSSKDIFDSKQFDISPASIRSILKELDDEGYLEQLHTSGGRVPTDKAYRSYIDSVLKLQNLAEQEKEKIEIEYERKIAELDYFLRHTTKILSDLTKKIGFSISADMADEHIKRIDIVKVSNINYIFIIVTENGLVKHYPFTIKDTKGFNIRNMLLVLNKRLRDFTIKEARDIIVKDFLSNDNSEIYYAIYDIFNAILKEGDEVFLEGMSSIYDESDELSVDELRCMARLLEEKEKFSKLIKERFSESLKRVPSAAVQENKTDPKRRRLMEISVGKENRIKELNNFSLITSAYSAGDKNFGLIGVIGPKRMEYPKVISIVDSMSMMIEDILKKWEEETKDL